MSGKSIVMTGMILGSVAGGYIPVLFGVGLFSFSSIIWTAVGGFLGIWLSYKFAERYL
jgi:hypothetical protein